MFFRFWWAWPSWITEFVSGLVVAAIVAGWPQWWLELALGTALSVGYELGLDVNGWSVRDVAQRQVGIVAGVLIAQFVWRAV